MRFPKVAVTATLPLVLVALLTCDAPLRHPAREQHRTGRNTAHVAPAAPRPSVVSRSTWHADEEAVRQHSSYMPDVHAVFVHHTNHPNDYRCSQVPAMLRTLQAGHEERGYDDIGYNFVVDRCGRIYEGRSDSVHHTVKGAHTKGFNEETLGIAALGSFPEGVRVPHAMLTAISKVAAWKLRPGADPRGRTRLRSDSDASRYGKGHTHDFHVISGHRDAYGTSCPGKALYDKLPALRDEVARIRRAARHSPSGPAGAPRR